MWRTPDFNPNAEKKFIPYTMVADSGLSAQTQAGLLRLEQEMTPQRKTDVAPVQTMQSTKGMVQLPSGQFVTPEQYQMLLQKLRKRK